MNVTIHIGDNVHDCHFTHVALLITFLAISLLLEEIFNDKLYSVS